MINTVLRVMHILFRSTIAKKRMKIPTEKTNRVMRYKKKCEDKRLERKSDGSSGNPLILLGISLSYPTTLPSKFLLCIYSYVHSRTTRCAPYLPTKKEKLLLPVTKRIFFIFTSLVKAVHSY